MPDLDSQPILGLDIGGTKLAAGVLDANGNLRSWLRVPTVATEGPEAVLERLATLGFRAIADAGYQPDEIVAVGVGCGGPLDLEAGLASPINLPGWVSVPVAPRLRDAFGIPTCLDNDANAGVLGEVAFGAARDATNVVYLTISTGIGGGVIADGVVLRGAWGNAAELGHVVVEAGGRPCDCGGRGCLEAYASGTSIARRAREAIASGAPTILPLLAGSLDLVTAETVAAAVRAGDELAAQLWRETIDALAAGIATIIHAFNPEVVVLGGGVTEAGEMLFEPLRAAVVERTMPALATGTRIVPAELGERLGVYGAAAVAGERLGLGPWRLRGEQPAPSIDPASRAAAAVESHLALAAHLHATMLPQIEEICELVCSALARGGRLIAFGNGGSAADAQHFVAELIGHYRRERPPLPALALTTDPSVVTCIGNDYGFADVFARQVEALAGPDDVIFGISTSGNAANVVRGLLAGRLRGATTIALTGGSGGSAARVAQRALIVPSDTTARIQEMHTLIVHLVSEAVDEWAAGRADAAASEARDAGASPGVSRPGVDGVERATKASDPFGGDERETGSVPAIVGGTVSSLRSPRLPLAAPRPRHRRHLPAGR